MYDVHIHWDQYPEEEWDELVQRSRRAGVKGLVAAAVDLASCRTLLYARKLDPEFIHIALGAHPEREHAAGELEEVLAIIRRYRDKIAAIGEVGLPWYSLPENFRRMPASEEDLAVLERFCRLAVELDKPVVLHAVHARASEALQVLRRCGVKRALFHWLKAPVDTVEKLVEEGYFVSVTPEVCYRERDRDLVRRVPLGQLLPETDGPWPYGGEFLGSRTEPVMIVRVAEEIARIKGVTVGRAREILADNARRLFRFPQ
ncbi:MAG: TatD family hydrolase [Alicyclobacillaceae bacterium]|nr:TatD family hydrolase [Alicyclobacillaceae bacterium]